MSTSIDSPNDELISAYLDGELEGQERAEVERLLADNPDAQRLADALTEVSEACRNLPPGRFPEGLAQRVLAETQQRIADGADKPMAGQADRLEPEGEFGLPFGRSSRGWVWAGVAAAAAVMISFFGRPEPPPQQNRIAHVQRGVTQQYSEATQVALQRIRQAAPQTRLVKITTTPEGLVALQQKLARQGIQLAVNPAQQARSAVQLVEHAGLAVDTEGNSSGNDQLMLVSAHPQRVGGLVNDLEEEGSLFQVEEDPGIAANSQDPLQKMKQQNQVWRFE